MKFNVGDFVNHSGDDPELYGLGEVIKISGGYAYTVKWTQEDGTTFIHSHYEDELE